MFQIISASPSVHPATVVQHRSFFFSNVSVHRRRLVRRTVERLVGLFIWFSAVLLWPIVLNVTVWSLFFALSMWKVHCTCGSLLFICPTSGFRRRPTGCKNSQCSERRPAPCDNLWAVACNPLLESFFLQFFAKRRLLGQKSVKMAQKSRFRARRAHLCDFSTLFSYFSGVARIFARNWV